MSDDSISLPPSYFDQVYAEQDDPWSFETSAYEAAKYRATLAALPRARYQRGFEIGCSIGVLTERLAQRCDDLVAVDVAERALARARERCRELPQVRFERRRIPGEFPNGLFDLIVVSEVGYYWSASELLVARQAMVQHLELGGHLLLVHWTPTVTDYPLTGDQVHEAFLSDASLAAGLRHSGGQREACYRLDLFERVDSRGAARPQDRESRA